MAVGFRPTFRITSTLTSKDALERVESALSVAGLETTRSRVAGMSSEIRTDEVHLLVRFPTHQRRTWSPWLHLDVHAVDDRRSNNSDVDPTPHESASSDGARTEPVITELHGRFSPHPSLWSAYMFGYLLIGTLSFFSIMFGYAQHASGAKPSAWWAVPICLVPAVLMWWASLVGQRFARSQMNHLRTIIDQALDVEAIDADRLIDTQVISPLISRH